MTASNPEQKILILDLDDVYRNAISIAFKTKGYDIDLASTPNMTLDLLQRYTYDGIVYDLSLPGSNTVKFFEDIQKLRPGIISIATSFVENFMLVLNLMKLGLNDFTKKPFKGDEIVELFKKASEKRLEQPAISSNNAQESGEQDPLKKRMIAKSQKMMDLFETARKISEYKTTVLITGGSGTGKELLAKAIHELSPRKNQAFVTVNCGAIPENLLESELFGHAKGAFTGAHKQKKGLFEMAHKGTLFLDEVGELPLLLQVKLLRVLQEEEIRKVGDVSSTTVDVRIIAATLRDLSEEVGKGNFREDLYYRLNVLPMHIPALKDRKDDVPILVEHFITKYNKKMGLKVKNTSKNAMDILLNYDWSGNVRELENTIERSMVLAPGEEIGVENLPLNIRNFTGSPRLQLGDDELSIKKMSRMLEEELITKALMKTRGNRTKAAKLLEISHRALIYKIQEFGLERVGES